MFSIFKNLMGFVKEQDRKTLINIIFFIGFFGFVFISVFPKFYAASQKIDKSASVSEQIKTKLDTVLLQQEKQITHLTTFIMSRMNEQTEHIDKTIDKKLEYLIKHFKKDASDQAIIDALREMKTETHNNFVELQKVFDEKNGENPKKEYRIGVDKK